MLLSLYRKGVKFISSHSLDWIGRFFVVRAINDFVLSNLKLNYADVQGHKMLVDPKASMGQLISGVYEPLMTEHIKNEIRKGDVVLDLGANIGYYTLVFAKLVGEDGKVFAFEPDPDNFAMLKKNVELNGYKNIFLIQKAVSNKNGKARLYLCEENKADHRICNLNDGRKSIEIESVRLDDFFKKYDGKIAFIKMDIQGAEGEALQGMQNLLKKNENVKIVAEFWPVGLKGFGVEPESFLGMLLKYGFTIYDMNEEKKKIRQITVAELLGAYTQEKKNFTNLLCKRQK